MSHVALTITLPKDKQQYIIDIFVSLHASASESIGVNRRGSWVFTVATDYGVILNFARLGKIHLGDSETK